MRNPTPMIYVPYTIFNLENISHAGTFTSAFVVLLEGLFRAIHSEKVELPHDYKF